MKSEMLSHYNIPSGTSKRLLTASHLTKLHILQNMMSRQASGQQSSSLTAFHSSAFSKPNSVTVTHSGSNMTITADNEKDLKNVVFTLTKTKGKYVEHIDECSPLILSGGSDVQEMVVSCYEDKDPVKAYLKITTPTGSAHINKTFTDYFGNAQTATADMYKVR